MVPRLHFVLCLSLREGVGYQFISEMCYLVTIVNILIFLDIFTYID
ncbi:hypothetical protein VIBNIFTn2_1240004 [Vibrio nigripulchritudo FTn2]|nr:hypothetical protein VIBNIFTn2_1240004 [Vibrio nigripulchritudo FTn2]